MINTNTFNVSQSLRQANPGADLKQMAEKVKDEEGLVQLIVSAQNGDEVSAANDFVNLTGAKNVERLDIIDGFTADVTPEAFAKLVENAPKGVTITFDETVSVSDPVELSRPEEMKEALEKHPSGAEANKGELDVTVKTLGMDKIWEQGYKGQGVTIAVIDTGIAPHPDYNDRVKGFKDWVAGKTEHYDDQGHGTHVAGCAQGDGKMSAGQYMGAAPMADLVGIKVLDKRGSGRLSDIIKGCQLGRRPQGRTGHRHHQHVARRPDFHQLPERPGGSVGRQSRRRRHHRDGSRRKLRSQAFHYRDSR